jgi:AcrR family transcriptional regulator
MSETAIAYDERMGRWEPDAQGRLQQAAMELYLERGFEQTTVAEIARRAGLTERTFFRYFVDKREVLFLGADGLKTLLVEATTAAPATTTPIEAIGAAIVAAGAMLQDRAEFSHLRQTVINANPSLQERELIKLASLATALAAALRERGVSEPAASLCAEAGVAVFRNGFERWHQASAKDDLPTLMQDSLDQLRAVTAATPSHG